MKKLILIFGYLLSSLLISAQGPAPSYYYHENTEIPWAECAFSFKNGSKQSIPFLPVINYFAPTGTQHYTKDVNIQIPIVFVGNGIQNDDINCYNGPEVKDKAVMFFYDFPDTVNRSAEEKNKLSKRIEKAYNQKVACIILCSYKKSAPFLRYQQSFMEEKSDIPVITLNKETASNILNAGSVRAESLYNKWEAGKIPDSKDLNISLELYIKGKYDIIETGRGELYYNGNTINEENMSQLADYHDQSVEFILELFKDANPEWKKTDLYYFSDYDAKTFYTHHWGHGASHPTGNYYVYRDSYGDLSENAYALTVHENTHTLFFKNWMEKADGANSFFYEGTAMYAQAMATDKDRNNQETYNYLKKGQLYPLSEMLGFNIGQTGLKTDVGYPASGSFVQYLIEEYGFNKFIILWETGDWKKAFNSTIDQMDAEWRNWLKLNK